MRSFKPEVQTAGDGQNWSGNALRFATKAEAEQYVKDLMWRWTAVNDTRVIESEDAVNYQWISGQGAVAIPPPIGA
jgi:hypothetical protein